jgi:hypothetical protein
MILTDSEKSFLDVFIFEATTDPFKGPATSELHQRDIFYSDLSDLMAAYYLEQSDESSPRVERSSVAPTCPWVDRDAVVRRNREVHLQLETANTAAS